ncbi:MAG TPA: response regulator [Amycolatopsis sp.]|jgi:two-component system KDP operon response regulator KdpE|nr:response regulator [Amycolatopsis sp.]
MTLSLIKVLVSDDDPQIVRALRINLSAHDYHVLTAADGATTLRVAAEEKLDAILLGLGLPGIDGMAVINRLRAWSSVPILALSGRPDPVAHIEALDAGADDVVAKPFRMDELLARLRAVLRRTARALSLGRPGETTVLDTGSFTVDLPAKKVTRQGEPVHLTPIEWGLLEILVRNPGRLVSQRHLLHQVWGPDYQTRTHYLRVYFSQLRRKLEPDPTRPRHFITEPGLGYRLER